MHDMAASLAGGRQDARHIQSMSAPDCAVFGGGDDQPLCNLYSVTKGQQAIRELAGAMRDRTGNLPPLYGIFPDYSAPIVRNQSEGRELTMARWGMPSPVFALKENTWRRCHGDGHACSYAPLPRPTHGSAQEIARAQQIHPHGEWLAATLTWSSPPRPRCAPRATTQPCRPAPLVTA
jgi:hypothetical protein